jgi:uncharacterized protein with NRDE domain
MCLILLAIRAHPRYRLIVAANRDEHFERPAAPAGWWADAPGVLGGRDLRQGGSWMAVSRAGRFAAVTNVRDPGRVRLAPPSRGGLVRDFVLGDAAAGPHLVSLAGRADAYDGFNLIVDDGREAGWLSNHGAGPAGLDAGVFGVSNHLLDTPWPKVESGKAALRALIEASGGGALRPEALLEVLQDRAPADDHALPSTGVGLELERMLSPRFIVSPGYGTRASTVLLVEHGGAATLLERSFAPGGVASGEVRHEFTVGARTERGTTAPRGRQAGGG